jgi:hypothetical protein
LIKYGSIRQRSATQAQLVLDGLVLLVADMAANPGRVTICGRLRLAVSLAGRGAALTLALARSASGIGLEVSGLGC